MAVNVGIELSVNNDETADGDVLLDDRDLCDKSIGNGLGGAVERESLESLDVCRTVCDDGSEKSLYELDKCIVLCNEVSLCVDLDHSGGFTLAEDIDNTLCRDTVCLLCGGGKTLLAEDLYSLVEIALSLGECLLALHHSAVGLCAELCNCFCCNCCHNDISFLLLHKIMTRNRDDPGSCG